MTDLALTEDQKQYRDLARDFTTNEIAARAHSLDEYGASAEPIWRQAFDVGLLSVRIPERFGGAGMSNQDACVIIEEIACGCTGVSATWTGNEMGQAPLLVAGTDDQRRQWLEPLTSKFALAGAFLPGYLDAGAASITYHRQGDNYVLSGSALAVNAESASWYFTCARDQDSNAISAFIVSQDASGKSTGKRTCTLGRRAADIAEIRLENVNVPAAQLIGEAGQGPELAQKAFATTAPLLAAEAVGLARSALEHAVRYSQERTTFGQPISAYQGVSFLLADMSRAVEASRLLARKAAYLSDHDKSSLKACLAACAQANEAAMKNATDAVQIFGGYGYSREYPVEKLMRDSKVLQMLSAATSQPRVKLGMAILSAVC